MSEFTAKKRKYGETATDHPHNINITDSQPPNAFNQPPQPSNTAFHTLMTNSSAPLDQNSQFTTSTNSNRLPIHPVLLTHAANDHPPQTMQQESSNYMGSYHAQNSSKQPTNSGLDSVEQPIHKPYHGLIYGMNDSVPSSSSTTTQNNNTSAATQHSSLIQHPFLSQTHSSQDIQPSMTLGGFGSINSINTMLGPNYAMSAYTPNASGHSNLLANNQQFNTNNPPNNAQNQPNSSANPTMLRGNPKPTHHPTSFVQLDSNHILAPSSFTQSLGPSNSFLNNINMSPNFISPTTQSLLQQLAQTQHIQTNQDSPISGISPFVAQNRPNQQQQQQQQPHSPFSAQNQQNHLFSAQPRQNDQNHNNPKTASTTGAGNDSDNNDNDDDDDDDDDTADGLVRSHGTFYLAGMPVNDSDEEDKSPHATVPNKVSQHAQIITQSGHNTDQSAAQIINTGHNGQTFNNVSAYSPIQVIGPLGELDTSGSDFGTTTGSHNVMMNNANHNNDVLSVSTASGLSQAHVQGHSFTSNQSHSTTVGSMSIAGNSIIIDHHFHNPKTAQTSVPNQQQSAQNQQNLQQHSQQSHQKPPPTTQQNQNQNQQQFGIQSSNPPTSTSPLNNTPTNPFAPIHMPQPSSNPFSNNFVLQSHNGTPNRNQFSPIGQIYNGQNLTPTNPSHSLNQMGQSNFNTIDATSPNSQPNTTHSSSNPSRQTLINPSSNQFGQTNPLKGISPLTSSSQNPLANLPTMTNRQFSNHLRPNQPQTNNFNANQFGMNHQITPNGNCIMNSITPNGNGSHTLNNHTLHSQLPQSTFLTKHISTTDLHSHSPPSNATNLSLNSLFSEFPQLSLAGSNHLGQHLGQNSANVMATQLHPSLSHSNQVALARTNSAQNTLKQQTHLTPNQHQSLPLQTTSAQNSLVQHNVHPSILLQVQHVTQNSHLQTSPGVSTFQSSQVNQNTPLMGKMTNSTPQNPVSTSPFHPNRGLAGPGTLQSGSGQRTTPPGFATLPVSHSGLSNHSFAPKPQITPTVVGGGPAVIFNPFTSNNFPAANTNILPKQNFNMNQSFNLTSLGLNSAHPGLPSAMSNLSGVGGSQSQHTHSPNQALAQSTTTAVGFGHFQPHPSSNNSLMSGSLGAFGMTNHHHHHHPHSLSNNPHNTNNPSSLSSFSGQNNIAQMHNTGQMGSGPSMNSINNPFMSTLMNANTGMSIPTNPNSLTQMQNHNTNSAVDFQLTRDGSHHAIYHRDASIPLSDYSQHAQNQNQNQNQYISLPYQFDTSTQLPFGQFQTFNLPEHSFAPPAPTPAPASPSVQTQPFQLPNNTPAAIPGYNQKPLPPPPSELTARLLQELPDFTQLNLFLPQQLQSIKLPGKQGFAAVKKIPRILPSSATIHNIIPHDFSLLLTQQMITAIHVPFELLSKIDTEYVHLENLPTWDQVTNSQALPTSSGSATKKKKKATSKSQQPIATLPIPQHILNAYENAEAHNVVFNGVASPTDCCVALQDHDLYVSHFHRFIALVKWDYELSQYEIDCPSSQIQELLAHFTESIDLTKLTAIDLQCVATGIEEEYEKCIKVMDEWRDARQTGAAPAGSAGKDGGKGGKGKNTQSGGKNDGMGDRPGGGKLALEIFDTKRKVKDESDDDDALSITSLPFSVLLLPEIRAQLKLYCASPVMQHLYFQSIAIYHEQYPSINFRKNALKNRQLIPIVTQQPVQAEPFVTTAVNNVVGQNSGFQVNPDPSQSSSQAVTGYQQLPSLPKESQQQQQLQQQQQQQQQMRQMDSSPFSSPDKNNLTTSLSMNGLSQDEPDQKQEMQSKQQNLQQTQSSLSNLQSLSNLSAFGGGNGNIINSNTGNNRFGGAAIQPLLPNPNQPQPHLNPLQTSASTAIPFNNPLLPSSTSQLNQSSSQFQFIPSNSFSTILSGPPSHNQADFGDAGIHRLYQSTGMLSDFEHSNQHHLHSTNSVNNIFHSSHLLPNSSSQLSFNFFQSASNLTTSMNNMDDAMIDSTTGGQIQPFSSHRVSTTNSNNNNNNMLPHYGLINYSSQIMQLPDELRLHVIVDTERKMQFFSNELLHHHLQLTSQIYKNQTLASEYAAECVKLLRFISYHRDEPSFKTLLPHFVHLAGKTEAEQASFFSHLLSMFRNDLIQAGAISNDTNTPLEHYTERSQSLIGNGSQIDYFSTTHPLTFIPCELSIPTAETIPFIDPLVEHAIIINAMRITTTVSTISSKKKQRLPTCPRTASTRSSRSTGAAMSANAQMMDDDQNSETSGSTSLTISQKDQKVYASWEFIPYPFIPLVINSWQRDDIGTNGHSGMNSPHEIDAIYAVPEHFVLNLKQLATNVGASQTDLHVLPILPATLDHLKTLLPSPQTQLQLRTHEGSPCLDQTPVSANISDKDSPTQAQFTPMVTLAQRLQCNVNSTIPQKLTVDGSLLLQFTSTIVALDTISPMRQPPTKIPRPKMKSLFAPTNTLVLPYKYPHFEPLLLTTGSKYNKDKCIPYDAKLVQNFLTIPIFVSPRASIEHTSPSSSSLPESQQYPTPSNTPIDNEAGAIASPPASRYPIVSFVPADSISEQLTNNQQSQFASIQPLQMLTVQGRTGLYTPIFSPTLTSGSQLNITGVSDHDMLIQARNEVMVMFVRYMSFLSRQIALLTTVHSQIHFIISSQSAGVITSANSASTFNSSISSSFGTPLINSPNDNSSRSPQPHLPTTTSFASSHTSTSSGKSSFSTAPSIFSASTHQQQVVSLVIQNDYQRNLDEFGIFGPILFKQTAIYDFVTANVAANAATGNGMTDLANPSKGLLTAKKRTGAGTTAGANVNMLDVVAESLVSVQYEPCFFDVSLEIIPPHPHYPHPSVSLPSVERLEQQQQYLALLINSFYTKHILNTVVKMGINNLQELSTRLSSQGTNTNNMANKD